MQKLLTIALSILAFQATSQKFTNVTPQNFESLNAGAFHAGDFNNDQTLDILVSGAIQAIGLTRGATNIYSNQGGFSLDLLQDQSLDSVFESSNLWGDFNQDGLLDIVVSGWLNGPLVTNMYFNNGNGQFVLNDQMEFEKLGYSDLAAGDLDLDGDIDFVNVGFSSSGARKSIIYFNNGDSTFNEVDDVLIGLGSGSVELADYDRDGDLDILVSGATGSVINDIDEGFTRLYQNTGGQFNLSHDFDPLLEGEAHWIDYNVDGKPDVILSGSNGTEAITKLYTNNGDSFSNSGLIFNSHSQVAIAVGDINSDGYPDVILSSTSNVVDVYINNRNNGFDELTGHELSGSFEKDIELADLDNDLDLDIMMIGTSVSSIYQNEIETINSRPDAPENLQVTQGTDTLTLTWDAGSDEETPTDALTYNYFIVFEGDTLVFANAHTTGIRKVQDAGNSRVRSSILSQSTPGSYSLGVQAIDMTLNASDFTILNFRINHPPLIQSVSEITIDEDDTVHIQLSDVVVVIDSDNVFPDDFTFSLTEGENYEVEGNSIIPDEDFFGELISSLRVFDGADSSNVVSFSIQVSPVNDPPIINNYIGQAELIAGESREFTVSEFDITDVDNDMSDLSLSFSEGANYQAVNATISPDETFEGELMVNVVASDGVDTSEAFTFALMVDIPLFIGKRSNGLKLYPNPVADQFHLDFDMPLVIKEIELISLSGKSIPIKWRDAMIDVSHINPGNYFVVIKDINGEQITKRIVIK